MSSVGPVLEIAPAADALIIEPARYVIDSHLAQGGMASLYLGRRLARSGFSLPVVLKRLRPELSHNPDVEALFLREAALCASLEHPAIVRTFDLTEIDGIPYMVMEHVTGGDLRLVLRRARRRNLSLLPAAALYLGRELCGALAYAHCHPSLDGATTGLIHRDVSPTNILLSVGGEIKLTDFGIALAVEVPSHGLRARGQIGYMSPEQARGETIDARSDLFSLAAVLYEVLTGRRLFVGQVGQRPMEVYSTEMVPPSQLCAGLPADLDALLMRTLALAKEERPESAQALYAELLEVTRRHNLWMDRGAFAVHLQEVCGADPTQWSTLEERTGTAQIASIGEEPSEPAITVPFPTVSTTPVEADETMTLPGRVVPEGLGAVVTPMLTQPPRRFGDEAKKPTKPAFSIADHIDVDLDAVTTPAAKVSAPVEPSAELEEPADDADELPEAALEHSTARHRALLPRGARLGGIFSRGRRLSRLTRDQLLGLFVGLVLSLLIWFALGLTRCSI